MATIRKRGDSYHVQIRKKGYPTVTKSFLLLADAQKWARSVERDIDKGVFQDTATAENSTLGDILDSYAKKILPSKKSRKTVLSQIRVIKPLLGNYSLSKLSPALLSQFRDQRLESADAQTVRKDLSLLHRVVVTAVKDWGISLPLGNPVALVRLLSQPNGRDRRLETGEEEKLLKALKDTPTVRTIVELALETAMRRGEIAAMKWEHVNLKARTLLIPDTKTGTPRTVPLSTKAIALLSNLPRNIKGVVFDVAPDSITQAFDRACTRAELEGLRFHDLRHEATSRLFEKGLNPMEVATITGHKDLRMLRRYTHLRAEDLARKLG